jgi:hypothetical protein
LHCPAALRLWLVSSTFARGLTLFPVCFPFRSSLCSFPLLGLAGLCWLLVGLVNLEHSPIAVDV